MWISSLYVLAGLGVGALIGLTGVGGGSVMTPLLVVGFGQPPLIAVGTDLAFATTIRLIVSSPVARAAAVDWQVVRRLAVGSMPATALVILLLWIAPAHSPGPDRVVRRALVLMLVATAMAVALQGTARRLGLRLTAASLTRVEKFRPAATIVAGCIVGVVAALTSVGAGAVMLTVLAGLYPLRLSHERLVATGIAHALPLTIIAAAGHALLGHLDVAALGLLLLGAVPGALLSQRTAWRMPPVVLRPVLATVLIGGAVRLMA
jgi:uncharacterized membrane protein YfcA